MARAWCQVRLSAHYNPHTRARPPSNRPQLGCEALHAGSELNSVTTGKVVRDDARQNRHFSDCTP